MAFDLTRDSGVGDGEWDDRGEPVVAIEGESGRDGRAKGKTIDFGGSRRSGDLGRITAVTSITFSIVADRRT